MFVFIYFKTGMVQMITAEDLTVWRKKRIQMPSTPKM